jgi:uncharacterized membrane protein
LPASWRPGTSARAFISSGTEGSPTPLLYSVLLWLHVFTAASWFGGVLLFGMVVGPTIGDFTPATSGEVVVKMLPKILRYLMIFTGVTPLLGLATALSYSNGNMSVFSPSTSFGMDISAGALLSLVSWVVVFAVVYPTGKKIVRITTEDMAKNQAPPSPLLPALAMRLKISSGVGLVLLIAILVFMVAAAS